MAFTLLYGLWLSVIAPLFFHPHGAPKPKEVTIDMKADFSSFQVEGSFLLYDPLANQYTMYNKSNAKKGYLPASTFKIPNTLIGLETCTITDPNEKIKWDGVKRQIESWNQDTDLQMAFTNSTVWYYQRIARMVGEKPMQQWVKKLRYGNQNIQGGVDQFWLSGKMRITSYEQIDFLRRVYLHQIPVSTANIALLEKLMIKKEGEGWILRGKTGWTEQDGRQVGWFVGYLTKGERVYFFATQVHAKTEVPQFITSRLALTEIGLQKMGLIPATTSSN